MGVATAVDCTGVATNSAFGATQGSAGVVLVWSRLLYQYFPPIQLRCERPPSTPEARHIGQFSLRYVLEEHSQPMQCALKESQELSKKMKTWAKKNVVDASEIPRELRVSGATHSMSDYRTPMLRHGTFIVGNCTVAAYRFLSSVQALARHIQRETPLSRERESPCANNSDAPWQIVISQQSALASTSRLRP